MLYAITCVDKPGAIETRLANRDAHIAHLKSVDTVFAGPFVDDDGDNMIGSLIVIDVPDRAAAETWAAEDPYARAGLFERVDIRAWRKVVG